MALKIETTLRNIREMSADDFPDGDYEILLGLQEDEIPVTVDCIATDGYYDITTPAGYEIVALSWYHLDGFDNEGIPALRM